MGRSYRTRLRRPKQKITVKFRTLAKLSNARFFWGMEKVRTEDSISTHSNVARLFGVVVQHGLLPVRSMCSLFLSLDFLQVEAAS